MSVESTVLQVVVMKDDAPVVAETLLAGQYIIGRDEKVDIRLNDVAILPRHAALYFQKGRVALQAQMGSVLVNGKVVRSQEVKMQDVVRIGPFTMKFRVVSQGAQDIVPDDIQQILDTPSQSEITAMSTEMTSNTPATKNIRVQSPSTPATVHTAPTQRNIVPQTHGSLARAAVPDVPHAMPRPPKPTRPQANDDEPQSLPKVKTVPPPAPAPQFKRVAHKNARSHRSRSQARSPETSGHGSAMLFVETFWGDACRGAYGFQNVPKGVIASESEAAQLPLFGFALSDDFLLAEEGKGTFRFYVPPGGRVEKQQKTGGFLPIEKFEEGDRKRPCLQLKLGDTIRVSGYGDMAMLAYVGKPLPKGKAKFLSSIPWLFLVLLILASGGFGKLAYDMALEGAKGEGPKSINPVAVRWIRPPKPEEKKKIEKKLEQLKHEDKVSKVEKALPKETPKDTKKVLKAVEKIVRAGPAIQKLLQTVQNISASPTTSKDAKLSNILGKGLPNVTNIASLGLGSGAGTKGSEVFRGKNGIGALGIGNIGKGSVSGTVGRAMGRSVAAQGSIDKDAVARVINSHLGEVSNCYERALLKESGLAGKINLEWTISTSGTVTTARVKSSTMKSSAVENCILSAVKTWKFPSAKGSGVVISYPFMFNAVGF